MKTKVILYIAISSDGFIADKNGGVSWLDQYSHDVPEDLVNNYPQFWQSIDCVVMGRKTYEQMLTFGDWPNAGKQTYVFTDSIERSLRKDVTFVSMNVKEFMQNFEKEHSGSVVWLEGGAHLIQQFAEEDLIDEYVITILPVKLYEGIPLPISIMLNDKVKLVDSRTFSNGIQQKCYSIAK